jgi:hypothetical protein
LGGASAPTMPHWLQTIRGPNAGTGTLSGHGSTLMIASRRQIEHDMASD